MRYLSFINSGSVNAPAILRMQVNRMTCKVNDKTVFVGCGVVQDMEIMIIMCHTHLRMFVC